MTSSTIDAEMHLAAIVRHSHDAIISKDLTGTIVTWNESATRVFGYTPQEAIGQSILMLIPVDRRYEEAEILARIRAGEVVDHFETIRRRKSGQLFPVSLTISPIRDRQDNIVGVSKIARDITEVKEAEARVHGLMREVNHRVKNQFAVILSMVRETENRGEQSVQEFVAQLRERIMALSRSQDLLVKGDWKGANLFELVLDHVSIFGSEDRVSLSGPAISLQPMAVQYLGMALHELTTNAMKYGALSRDDGTISVDWRVVGSDFELRWREAPDIVSPPKEADPTPRRGFGTVVLEKIAPSAVSGHASIVREEGVCWTLIAPMSAIERKCPPERAEAEFVSPL